MHRRLLPLVLLAPLPGCIGPFAGAALGDAVDDHQHRPVALADAPVYPPGTTLRVVLNDGRRGVLVADALRDGTDTLVVAPLGWIARRDIAHVQRPRPTVPRALTYAVAGLAADYFSYVAWPSCQIGVVCWILR